VRGKMDDAFDAMGPKHIFHSYPICDIDIEKEGCFTRYLDDFIQYVETRVT
jgi:hypothetical protein